MFHSVDSIMRLIEADVESMYAIAPVVIGCDEGYGIYKDGVCIAHVDAMNAEKIIMKFKLKVQEGLFR